MIVHLNTANPVTLGAEVSDRRSKRRFPLRMEMLYRPAGSHSPADWRAAQSLNLSSTGLLFSGADAVLPGQQIEALVDWPARLNHRVDLRLALRGTIVRSSGEMTAMRVDHYEFRQRSPADSQPEA